MEFGSLISEFGGLIKMRWNAMGCHGMPWKDGWDHGLVHFLGLVAAGYAGKNAGYLMIFIYGGS